MSFPEYNLIDISKFLARKLLWAKVGKIIRCIYLPLLIIFIFIWVIPEYNIVLGALGFICVAIFFEMMIFGLNDGYVFRIYHNISKTMKKRKKLCNDDLNELWNDEKKKNFAMVINQICVEFADWNYNYKFLPEDSFSVMTGSVLSNLPNERCLKAIEKILNIRLPEPEELENISFRQFVDSIYTEELSNAAINMDEEKFCNISKYKFSFWYAVKYWGFASVFVYFFGTLIGCIFYVFASLSENPIEWNWEYIYGPLITIGCYWIFGLLFYVIISQERKAKRKKAVWKSSNEI